MGRIDLRQDQSLDSTAQIDSPYFWQVYRKTYQNGGGGGGNFTTPKLTIEQIYNL